MIANRRNHPLSLANGIDLGQHHALGTWIGVGTTRSLRGKCQTGVTLETGGTVTDHIHGRGRGNDRTLAHQRKMAWIVYQGDYHQYQHRQPLWTMNFMSSKTKRSLTQQKAKTAASNDVNQTRESRTTKSQKTRARNPNLPPLHQWLAHRITLPHPLNSRKSKPKCQKLSLVSCPGSRPKSPRKSLKQWPKK